MPNKKIVTGQAVTEKMRIRARTLRRDMTPAETILWRHLRARRLGVVSLRYISSSRGFIRCDPDPSATGPGAIPSSGKKIV